MGRILLFILLSFVSVNLSAQTFITDENFESKISGRDKFSMEDQHSIVVVEHNLELIKCADHIIDLGPEAGEKGGCLVGQGTPESIIKIKKSHTGKYLKNKLE